MTQGFEFPQLVRRQRLSRALAIDPEFDQAAAGGVVENDFLEVFRPAFGSKAEFLIGRPAKIFGSLVSGPDVRRMKVPRAECSSFCRARGGIDHRINGMRVRGIILDTLAIAGRCEIVEK